MIHDFENIGFDMPIELYDPYLLQNGIHNDRIASYVSRGIESLRTSNVAVLAPGSLTRYVTDIIPKAPVFSSADFEIGYDYYILACSPFIYFEVVNDLRNKGFRTDNLVFPFEKSPYADAVAILNTIDTNKWKALIDKYSKTHTSVNSATKYLDINVFLAEAIYRVWCLKLNNIPPQKMLDIGSGACLFSHACKYYGHTSYGFDISLEDIHPCYVEIAELLNVHVFNSTIKTPFTGFGCNFDLRGKSVKEIQAPKRIGSVSGYAEKFSFVTAFATCFSEGWKSSDYKMFFNNLRQYSDDSGVCFYSLPNYSSMIADEVFPALISVGAEIQDLKMINGFVKELRIILD